MKAATIRLAAAGRAYNAVAQSSAIAIQDATDYLRSMSTISSTAAGIGMAVFMVDKGKGTAIINEAMTLGQKSVTQFSNICSAAIQVATNYPKAFG